MSAELGFNVEQLEADLRRMEVQLPSWAVMLPPLGWVSLIGALNVAQRCEDLTPEQQKTCASLAQLLRPGFPKEYQEFHKMFEAQFPK